MPTVCYIPGYQRYMYLTAACVRMYCPLVRLGGLRDARNRTLLQSCRACVSRTCFARHLVQVRDMPAQVRRAKIAILPTVASTFATCLRGFLNKMEHNWWAFVTTDVCEHPGDDCAADGTRRKNAGERLLIPVAAAAWRNLVPVPRALDGAGPDVCTSIAQYLNLIALECHAQGRRRCMTAQEGARDGTRPTCCYHRPSGTDISSSIPKFEILVAP